MDHGSRVLAVDLHLRRDNTQGFDSLAIFKVSQEKTTEVPASMAAPSARERRTVPYTQGSCLMGDSASCSSLEIMQAQGWSSLTSSSHVPDSALLCLPVFAPHFHLQSCTGRKEVWTGEFCLALLVVDMQLRAEQSGSGVLCGPGHFHLWRVQERRRECAAVQNRYSRERTRGATGHG